MRTEQRQSLIQIMNSIEGVELKEKRGGRFHFRLHFTNQMNSIPIEDLLLSERAKNALKRAGYHTVGALAKALSEGTDLKSIRNCGVKCVIIPARILSWRLQSH